MVKRINVSVSDELYEKIQSARQGFRKEFNLSKIFQNAIENELEGAVRRDTVWNDGFHYGVDYLKSLDHREQIKAKSMVATFPRRLPKDIFKPLILAEVITEGNLGKQTSLRRYWKAVEERFDFLTDVGDRDSWDEWVGTPPVHEGVEISETGIIESRGIEIQIPDSPSSKKSITTYKSAVNIRYAKVIQLWREGLIAGIKDATKTLEEADNENE